jgi:hypothetical protein
MKKSGVFSLALPHIIAVVVFLIISILLYRPIIFEGKVMDQNDINQGVGSSKEIVDYRNATGEEALWTNAMFGGMPAYLISVQWSGAFLMDNMQRLMQLYMPRPVGENFIAFISFYILLLAFGVRPYLALSGALAFGLSTFYVISIQAGHMWKIRAIAYMPMVLAGVKLVFSRKYLLGFILTAIALALEINANHLQITYYLFLVLGIYGISELIYEIKSGKLKSFATKISILAIAGILAAGVNAGRLWTTMEYSKYSIRGKSEITAKGTESETGLERDYAFRWSSGKWESMTLFIPHLYGGASGVYTGNESETSKLLRQNNAPLNEVTQIERAYLGYWGSQPGTAGPAYAGAVVCFLFILAFFFVDSKDKYWISAAILLSVMLSWGSNFPSFNNLVFDLLPGYNKFRAVTMIIILALMLVPMMGFMGLQKLIDSGWNPDNRKKLLIATGIASGIAILALIVTNPAPVDGIQKVFADAIKADRKDIIRNDVIRTIFYVLLIFGSIWLLLTNKITSHIFATILTLLVVLDLGLVDSRYLNDSAYHTENNRTFFTLTPADERILADTEAGYRVLNLQDPFNEARTSYFHKSLGGYHGAKTRRYQDLITNQLVPEMQQIMQDKRITAENSNVISMLNAKYLMVGQQAEAVIKNPYANGAAWFVDSIEKVKNPDEELQKIGEVDLHRVAVLDEGKFSVGAINNDSTATISLTKYQPNRLEYEATTNSNSLAVFSEIYYPEGWKVLIDGNEGKILRVNYILRALELTPGTHKIEFRFEPASYYLGNKIMLGTSLILLLIVGYGIFRLWKEGKNPGGAIA